MHQITTVITAVTHQLYGAMLDAAGRHEHAATGADDVAERDRGAVSLEQVMWFVAAGVAVAVIASILFQRIRYEANNSPIDSITPPAGRAP